MSTQPKAGHTPFEAPEKKAKKKRLKQNKQRLHIYLSEECINRIDMKSSEFDLDRSPCIQMLLNYALNNMKKAKFPPAAQLT
jgi:hypothetical protein